jgi:dienelactone hydrolase
MRRFIGPATACLLAVGTLLRAAAAANEAPSVVGLQQGVVLHDYTPLSGNTQLVRRLMSPLAAAQILEQLQQSSQQLIEQSLDLAAERFTLYVPPRAPPAGYGLLVFVPPGEKAPLPEGWGPVLDQFGVIFASAERSGNDENVLARREPLALLAAYNLMQRFHVDPERVFVGGFSGGSRIAMRLALAYPDLFHGVLLNAGSDPLGDAEAGAPPLPPRDLWLRFQESSHLVYVTGERDLTHQGSDAASLQSMRRWCVFALDVVPEPGAGHQAATPKALGAALHALAARGTPAAAKLAACRADFDRVLDAQLERVRALAAAGQRDAARKLLLDIDRRYGGVAAPRTLELEKALGAPAA